MALGIEGRSYIQSSDSPDQFANDIAISIEPEVRHRFNNNDTAFTFISYGRWDDRDSERTHFDIRELNLLHTTGDWEFLAGLGKVFWGVAESSHLVDIINQTDLLEGIDGEDKLGQQMVRVSRVFDRSTLSAFVLPGFRERKFLSLNNPVGLPFPINNLPIYEDSDGDNHVDLALRYSGYQGIVDYGVSWFSGTSREPNFIPGSDGRLVPFYPQIDQFGIDLQITSDAWLWKFEGLRRTFSSTNSISGNDFTALVGGLEYSFYGMKDGLFDLGLLAEYHSDSRDDPATVIFQNDLFFGLRFGFNDAESSEILAGTFFDQDDHSASYRIEANRRVLGDARLSLEAQVFSNSAPGNVTFSQRHSDFVLVSLEYFF